MLVCIVIWRGEKLTLRADSDRNLWEMQLGTTGRAEP